VSVGRSKYRSPAHVTSAWQLKSAFNSIVFLRKSTWWRPNPEPLPHGFKGREIDASGKPLG
jgi:hypothetical protein